MPYETGMGIGYGGGGTSTFRMPEAWSPEQKRAASRARESAMLSRTAVNLARAGVQYGGGPGVPTPRQALASAELATRDYQAASRLGVTSSAAWAHTSEIAPDAPFATRREAIELTGAQEWGGTVYGGYTPTPDPSARWTTGSDLQRLEAYKREAEPVPAYQLEPHTGFIEPEFYQGQPISHTPAMTMQEDGADVDVTVESGKATLMDNLTIVSLVLGIMMFFR